jgi:hypothetical protein
MSHRTAVRGEGAGDPSLSSQEDHMTVYVAVIEDINRPSVAVFTSESAAWKWIENEMATGWVFEREVKGDM